MVKGNPKASASSGTRKKHARRAATHNQPDEPELPNEKKAKGKEKGKKMEPRQKMYIPPLKPVPPQPDPLDTSGLAHSLPPELLVALRSLGKKAEVTKIRALEVLQLSWADQYKDGEKESIAYTLAEMLPVWVRVYILPLQSIHSITSRLCSSIIYHRSSYIRQEEYAP